MTDALTQFVTEAQSRPVIRYTRHDVKFTGTAGEYFGIWIVNVLLGIATIGVYTAWAKVRNKKYFYGNTFIDGNNFDYHATGKQILIGRLIVVSILAVVYFLRSTNIEAYLWASLFLFLCVGFFVSRAVRFNARMSSYRNVRFNFAGNAWRGILSFGIYPVLNILTLYLALPFVTRSKNRYTTRFHKYGDRFFYFDSEAGRYYGPFFAMLGIGFIFLIIAALISNFVNNSVITGGSDMAFTARQYVQTISVFGTFLTVQLIYRGAVRNIIFNNTVLDDKHRFESTVDPGRYMWIHLSNAFLAIVTLGLMIPWGKVRLARYMAENTWVLANGNLDGYSSEVIDTHGVTAAEYTDMDGIDIDIGI